MTVVDTSGEQAAAAANFKHLPKVSRAVDDGSVHKLLQKWGMAGNLRCCTFQYSKRYHHMQAEEFLTDFFNDTAVQSVFQVVTADATWAPLSGAVTSLECVVVKAAATSMDVFDRLADAPEPILRPGTWEIVQCFEDEREGFIIQDRLRELILAVEDSENADVIGEADRQQFLWLLFEHLVLGGSMNQFEDSAETYIDLAKRLYKDLVTYAPFFPFL